MYTENIVSQGSQRSLQEAKEIWPILPKHYSYEPLVTSKKVNPQKIIPMTAPEIQEGIKARAMVKRMVEPVLNSYEAVNAPEYIVNQAKRIVMAIKPEIETETKEFAKLVEHEIRTLMKFYNKPNLYI